MPKQARELTALDIKRLTHPGTRGNFVHAAGGVAGLLLQITPGGAKTWLLRGQVGAKRREIGLGGYPEIPLAMARERAREAMAAGCEAVLIRLNAGLALMETSQKEGAS